MKIPPKVPIKEEPSVLSLPRRATSPREAILSPRELIPVEDAIGRTLAAVTVGCPPAVPIVVSGEIIDTGALSLFNYYGIDKVWVVKEQEKFL